MLMSGCQGKPEPKIIEKICPECGNEIEIISTDVDAVCENCGFKIYNETLNCVTWCKYAKECVGEEMYRHMMKIAENIRSGKTKEAGS